MLIEGDEHFPDVLGILAFSAPTGESTFATSLFTPGEALGEGFWTLTAGLNFIQTYDPIVIFYGAGYRHRFENTVDGLEVDPGKQIWYRFGLGFAVNSKVTLSASFQGSYITEDYVNGNRLVGSIREPMNVRLAATFSHDKRRCGPSKVQLTEPFVNFGVTEDAIDALFGISFTR
jgi:hypothetical protein